MFLFKLKYYFKTIKITDEEIIFNTDFNNSISYMPPTIKKVVFGYDFNQPLTKINFSPNLTYLSLGFVFNHPIVNIPDTLEVLKLSEFYTLPFNFTNMHNVKKIVIANRYKGDLINLPVNLEEIKYEGTDEGYASSFPTFFNNYPPKLKKFTYSSNKITMLDNLPSTLEYLDIANCLTIPSNVNLPNSLKVLRLNYKLAGHIKKIPFGCKVIYIQHKSMYYNYGSAIRRFFEEIDMDNIININDNTHNDN